MMTQCHDQAYQANKIELLVLVKNHTLKKVNIHPSLATLSAICSGIAHYNIKDRKTGYEQKGNLESCTERF